MKLFTSSHILTCLCKASMPSMQLYPSITWTIKQPCRRGSTGIQQHAAPLFLHVPLPTQERVAAALAALGHARGPAPVNASGTDSPTRSGGGGGSAAVGLLVRVALAAVGRGGAGEVGQRIRDEILAVQQRNGCKVSVRGRGRSKQCARCGCVYCSRARGRGAIAY